MEWNRIYKGISESGDAQRVAAVLKFLRNTRTCVDRLQVLANIECITV